MKKARLFSLLALVIALALSVLVGCGAEEEKISAIAIKDYASDSVIEVERGAFDYSAYTVVVTYESGKTEERPLDESMLAETEQVKFYQVGEHEITVSYGGSSCVFKTSVKRSFFENVSFPGNNVFTYDGEAHIVELQGNIPANAVVTYPGGNSFVNVGTYDVTAIVSCEGYVTASISTTVKIVKATYDMSGVVFEAKEFVYDGQPHSVAISGTLPEGVSAPTYIINEKVTASAVDVGVYTVVARFSGGNPNYEPIPDMETTLTITPAEFVVSGVTPVFKRANGTVINGYQKIYDGSAVTIELDGYDKISKKVTAVFSVMDEDGNVISSSGEETNIINAGLYTVKVDFTLTDGKNYKPIEPLLCEFEVLKTEHPPLENIEFLSAQTTYDGKGKTIAVVGELPEGVSVEYEYYYGRELVVDADGLPVRSVVDAGRYIVKAIFTHTDENRGKIPEMSAVLNVEKAKVDVTMLGVVTVPPVEYTGTPHQVQLLTWKEIFGTEFEVLSYSTIGYFRLVGDEYVKMEDGELPTNVGTYKYEIAISILDEYRKNYVLQSGENESTFTVNVTINPKTIALPDVTFLSESKITYDGSERAVQFTRDGALDGVTENAAYYALVNGGYVESVPVNAGSYRYVVTYAIEDEENYVFSNGQMVHEYVFEFVINPKTVALPDVTFSSEPERTYDGSEQEVQFTRDGALDGVTENAAYYALVNGGYVESVPVNAGSYRYVVTYAVEDEENYVFSNGQTVHEYVYEFVILPIVITVDIDALTLEGTLFEYREEGYRPAVNGIPEHLVPTTKMYPVSEWEMEREIEIERAFSTGQYKIVVSLAVENSNYQLSGENTHTLYFKITGTVVKNLDVLMSDPDFYIELPDADGAYYHDKDDTNYMAAILAQVFGDDKSSLMNVTINTPTNSETGTYLSPWGGAIDKTADYTIPCLFEVVDTTQYCFIYGEKDTLAATITFKVKFV